MTQADLAIADQACRERGAQIKQAEEDRAELSTRLAECVESWKVERVRELAERAESVRTLKGIKARIGRIRKAAGYEFHGEAHGYEDELRYDFIKWVSEHGPAPLAKRAALILTTEEIEFERWTS